MTEERGTSMGKVGRGQEVLENHKVCKVERSHGGLCCVVIAGEESI